MMRLERAAALARLSELAYEDPETVRKAVAPRRMTFIEKADTQVYIVRGVRASAVIFRGTQVTKDFSWSDLRTNILLRKQGWAGAGRVHRGYKAAALAVLDDLKAALTDNIIFPVFYTGHSLGGALATVMTAMLPVNACTYSFGSPKVGNRAFVKALSRPVYRFVHAADIAPKYPRWWMGYRHGSNGAPVELWRLSRDGVVYRDEWRVADAIPFPIAIGVHDHGIGTYAAKLKDARLGSVGEIERQQELEQNEYDTDD